MNSPGISHRAIADTPVTVVDTETTGLYAGGDRVIEIAVVRAEPGTEPKVLVDTLVNPRRPVAATEIHGISDEDVADAPTFEDVAPAVVDALCHSVFASYNVYFDARFVREELRRIGMRTFPPHLCLMYLRPMLGLGRKCSLRDACADSGVTHSKAHHAAADAMAAAALWTRYVQACGRSGVRTFGELAALRDYKFTTSFAEPMLDQTARLARRGPLTMKSRAALPRRPATPAQIERSDRQFVLAAYWEALTAALADLDVTPYEVFYLRAKQSALGVRPEELRWMHARAFSGILADMCQDKAITDDEATALSGVALALRELGWAPGDEPLGDAALL
jgi:DNA polymerase III subunit epsilon